MRGANKTREGCCEEIRVAPFRFFSKGLPHGSFEETLFRFFSFLFVSFPHPQKNPHQKKRKGGQRIGRDTLKICRIQKPTLVLSLVSLLPLFGISSSFVWYPFYVKTTTREGGQQKEIRARIF